MDRIAVRRGLSRLYDNALALGVALLAAELARRPAAYGNGAARGRFARSPRRIPLRGWKDILIRVAKETPKDNIPLIAAGVTFFIVLSVFPALISFVSLYGLIADPRDVPQHLGFLRAILPREAVLFLVGEVERLARAQSGGLSWTLALGLVISLWSANSAAKAMFLGLNIAYEEREKRGVIGLNLASLGFTFGLIVLSVLLAAIMVAAPTVAAAGLAMPGLLENGRWLIQFAVLIVVLAVLYRFGPSREQARWQWVTWGGAAAALLWIAVSALFSFYVAHIARFQAVYGPLAAAVGFFIWVYWSVLIVLLGAELNAEIEHQTACDSTTGAPEPMGRRGATMADTLGEASN
jgi:membrane protein